MGNSDGKATKKPKDMCTHCWDGASPAGQQWHRARNIWKPNPHVAASWDFPEWYDVMEEWKCSTLMIVWSEDVHLIEEL